MELAVLRGFHYWSKATVTLCVSVSAVTLFSPKTISASDINISLYCIQYVCVCVTIIAINNILLYTMKMVTFSSSVGTILNNHVRQTIVAI